MPTIGDFTSSPARATMVAGSLGIAGAALLAACDRLTGKSAAPTFRFTDITGAEFARKLELPDVDARPRSLADWKGKVTVVFFGYTQCPDVCPTTMAELAQIRTLLGNQATPQACPATYDTPAQCTGKYQTDNSFYGRGIVDALRAVQG